MVGSPKSAAQEARTIKIKRTNLKKRDHVSKKKDLIKF